MPFIPHTEADISEMLAAIGAPSIEALFDEIPANLRIQSLAGIPTGLSEMEIGRLMSDRARQDGRPLSFLGAVPTSITSRRPYGPSRREANFIVRTRRTRQKPARARCN